ncbi:MAG: hypothetical protein JNL82_13920 [Myxococcales bacterium]|nr:hypothetical protein [Myxococcales bacterium]
MDRLKIPSLALLGLSLVSCKDDAEDSIVGTWDATMLGDLKVPGVSPDEGYMFSIDMVIEDDLQGTYNFRAMYDGEEEVGTYAITVDDSMAPRFTIDIPEVNNKLSCTLSGRDLECKDLEDTLYKFKKR